MSKIYSRILFLSLLMLGACNPVDAQSVGEGIQNIGNAVVFFYIAILFILTVLTGTGLLIWQRNHPMVKKLLNPILGLYRRLTGKMPQYHFSSAYTQHEEPLLEQAKSLVSETDNILATNKQISNDRQVKIRTQTRSMLANMVRLLERLATVRKLIELETVGSSNREELEKIDFSLQMQLERSLDTLQNVPVGLMKVEISRADRAIDRLIDDLGETNASMSDLAESYNAIKRLS